ncbi:BLUF domain-containing protein [Pontimicrobium sp. MEBiC01747]
MLKTICYVSSSDIDLNISDLNELFKTTIKNNTHSKISGILIYKNGNFLQIIEGEENQIDKLYTKICLDARHHGTILIIETKICDRVFDNYSTEFPIINNNKQMLKLKHYLNWLKEAELHKVNKLIRIIENFIEIKVLTAI